jgi:hypothetical protein
VILAVEVAVTAWLVTVKFADVAPVDTVTLAGTVAAVALLLDRVTVLWVVVPAAGAFKVNVPVELLTPPETLVGLSVNDATTGKLTTSEKLWTALGLTPFDAANVTGYVAGVAEVGVPLRVPVLALKLTPTGNEPDSLSVGVGRPVAVTVNEPNLPTVKVVVAALVIAGA